MREGFKSVSLTDFYSSLNDEKFVNLKHSFGKSCFSHKLFVTLSSVEYFVTLSSGLIIASKGKSQSEQVVLFE